MFHHSTQNKWYLIFQNGNAAYSTNSDITNPAGWTAPTNFFSSQPSIITQNIGSGYWVDMWVICDSANCYLFSSDDNGHLYRSSTTVANFPSGFGNTAIAASAAPDDLFEASNVYKVGDQYLLIVECIGSTGHRYFRSWTATSLSGSWTALAATETNPFAGSHNVQFPSGTWTADISHGEVVRTNVDQTMTLPGGCMQYLYQGLPTGSTGDYNTLPWKLALLTETNCASSSSSATSATSKSTTTTKPTTTTTASGSTGTGVPLVSTYFSMGFLDSANRMSQYGQCGGINYTGSTTCAQGTCTYSNPYVRIACRGGHAQQLPN